MGAQKNVPKNGQKGDFCFCFMNFWIEQWTVLYSIKKRDCTASEKVNKRMQKGLTVNEKFCCW